MSGIPLIETVLSIVDKLLNQVPDYEERKKIKYRKLKKRYLDEMNREWRDDGKVCECREDLRSFLETM